MFSSEVTVALTTKLTGAALPNAKQKAVPARPVERQLGRALPIANADTNDTDDNADNRWPEREEE